jgi:hypothetical protein
VEAEPRFSVHPRCQAEAGPRALLPSPAVGHIGKKADRIGLELPWEIHRSVPGRMRDDTKAGQER